MKFTQIKTSQKPTYPYYGKFASGGVVLFVAPGTGTVIKASDLSHIGDYSTNWVEEKAERVHGVLEL